MQIPSRFDRVPIVKPEWNQEPKEDIFTRDNHQPKWIQMVYSQGHSTYHSSYNLTGRNHQLPHKKNNACHWGSSSQNIQNMVWTQHLFDTTSQIRPDDKSLLNISISPDMEACMPWDTFHIFQLLRIVFHLGSWWDGRGCTAQENSPGFNQPKGGFFSWRGFRSPKITALKISKNNWIYHDFTTVNERLTLWKCCVYRAVGLMMSSIALQGWSEKPSLLLREVGFLPSKGTPQSHATNGDKAAKTETFTAVIPEFLWIPEFT